MRISTHPLALVPLVFVAATLSAATAAAQTPAPVRPWGRVSFFTNASRAEGDARGASADFITSLNLMLVDGPGNGLEYGLDLRHSRPTGIGRDQRVSLYDGFVGVRVAGGRLRLRGGQMWLSDLGGLGSLAGALVEFRQPVQTSRLGRWRFGAFGGVEPDPYRFEYVPGIRKAGGYVSLEGSGGRRHTAGYVQVRHGALTERSVVTFTNFVNVRSRLFVYQSGEYDLGGPAGQTGGGFTYFFANARINTGRLETQGIFSRGRSLDVRRIVDDVLNGRPLPPGALDGLLYESAGVRLTATILPGVRVYGGYTRDRTNRDSADTGRVLLGGSVRDLAGTGIDLTFSDSRIERPTGRYHAVYASGGRQIGRSLYLSADYSTSLSILRFTRLDGIVVETRPETRQIGASAIWNLGRHVSIVTSGMSTRYNTGRETRVLAGVAYRFR